MRRTVLDSLLKIIHLCLFLEEFAGLCPENRVINSKGVSLAKEAVERLNVLLSQETSEDMFVRIYSIFNSYIITYFLTFVNSVSI